MFNFMKTFRQYFDEDAEEREEMRRHRTAVYLNKAQRRREELSVKRTPGTEDDRLHRIKWKTKAKAEMSRHIRHRRSKYKKAGRSTTGEV